MTQNYSTFTKKFFTYIINTCLLMDKSYYRNEDIIFKDNSKYFTNLISIDKKLKVLYGFDYQNNINKNKKIENIYKKTKHLINILLKYLIIIQKNKNKLNLINKDKELILLANDLVKINLNDNILEYILFYFYYDLDSYINSVSNLAEIVTINNLYLNENIDLKEIKIDILEKIVNKYYSKKSKNLKKISNNEDNYYNIENIQNISYNEPSFITKKVIELTILHNLV